jgi:hypothetical protein
MAPIHIQKPAVNIEATATNVRLSIVISLQ